MAPRATAGRCRQAGQLTMESTVAAGQPRTAATGGSARPGTGRAGGCGRTVPKSELSPVGEVPLAGSTGAGARVAGGRGAGAGWTRNGGAGGGVNGGAVAKAMPLIASFGEHRELRVIGGHGLAR